MEQPHRNGAPLDLVELLFFAYRDFVGEADRVLAQYGFGRAHHRVLHFVHTRPGLTVAELLTILDITKQSLARVLRDLVSAGLVDQRPGETDRRKRRLNLTEQGAQLARRLLSVQEGQINRALDGLAGDQHVAVEAFLLGLVDPQRRQPILKQLQVRQ